MYVAWMLVFENPFNGEFFIRTLFQLTSCLSFMQTVYLYFKLLKNTTIKTFSPQFLLHQFLIKYKMLLDIMPTERRVWVTQVFAL